MRAAYVLKRAIDYTAAAAGLVVLSPALLAVTAAIRVDSPGGALFRHERVGRGGKPFNIIKFRTLHAASPVEFNQDGSTRVEAGDARVTRVGRYLRGAFDELPQLWNVLRGEMSLVGPRPDMPVHAAQYSAAERRKLDVLPGITSLAAVVGRNQIPWKKRIAIDLRYIEHWSLGLDARILAQTFFLPFGVHLFDFQNITQEVTVAD